MSETIVRHRICIAPDCDAAFYAKRKDTQYCSPRCRAREANRRFRQTQKAKDYKRAWLAANTDRSSDYSVRWYENGGAAVRAEYKRNNREKARAHTAVLRAIERGELQREPCEVCGASRADAHHSDYTKPLAVAWLCRKHHLAVHSGEVVLSLRS